MFTEVINKLDNIIQNMLYKASPATRSVDLVPSYVLVGIANVLEALMFNKTNERFDVKGLSFDQMKLLTERVVQMIDTYLNEVYLETQVTGEVPIVVDAGYFSSKGQRQTARNVGKYLEMEGTEAKAVLPEGLMRQLNVEDDEEVFQTITSMITNPFDWGYEDVDVMVNSQVLTVSFRFAENKSDIVVADLPDNSRIQLWIPKKASEDGSADDVPTFVVHLQPNQSLQTALNLSDISDTGSGFHIEIKADSVPGVMAYLGLGYEPFWYKFDDSLNITVESQASADRTDYTLFLLTR